MPSVKPPAPATVISVIALMVALSGTSYAITRPSPRTVGAVQLKTGAVTRAKIKNNAVNSAKVAPGSLQLSDFAAGQIPQVGQMTVVTSAQVPFGSTVVQSATALCPGGQRVVSGGGVSISDEQLAATQPTGDRSGWAVIGVDLIGVSGAYVQAYALCAPAGQAVAASWSKAKVRREVDELTAKVRAHVRR